MSWLEALKERCFTVHAQCVKGLFTPLRVHIKYTRCSPDIESRVQEIENEIYRNFEKGVEVKVTKEITKMTVDQFFEVWVVGGGRALHSKRRGDGNVDSDAKLAEIIEGIRHVLTTKICAERKCTDGRKQWYDR